MKQLLMSPLIAVLCITDLLMETNDFLQLCFTNLAWRKNASLLLYSAFLQLLCDWPLIYFLLQPQCSVICHDRISYMAQNATCWESALDGFQLWWCIMLQQEMKLKSSGKMRVIPLSQTHHVLRRLGWSCCGWRMFVSRSYEKISVWSASQLWSLGPESRVVQDDDPVIDAKHNVQLFCVFCQIFLVSYLTLLTTVCFPWLWFCKSSMWCV